MAKDIGSLASSSGTKSKNKLSKKISDALKKRLAESQVTDKNPLTGVVFSDETRDNHSTKVCKKFILVDDYNPMVITPLGVQLNPIPDGESHDAENNMCTLNTDPTLLSSTENDVDEYVMINSEDDVNKDSLSLNDDDENDTLSEHLISVFSPSNDAELQEEINQVAQEQGLSPKGMNQIKGQSKKTNTKHPATSGRANTRLFISKPSQ